MMHVRVVGISIGAHAVAAVLTRGGVARAAAFAAIESSGSVEAALERCLADLRMHLGWRTVACRVVLGASRTQVRRVASLPVLKSARAMHAMMQMGVREHFLGADDSLSIVTGAQDADGSVWVLACAEALYTSMVRTAESANLRVESIAPAIDVVAASGAETSGELTVRDGSFVIAKATVSSGRLSGVSRRSSQASESETPRATSTRIRQELEAILPAGACVDDLEFARLAAERLPRARFASVTLPAASTSNDSRHVLALSLLAAGLTILALAAPGLRARSAASAAEREIALLAARFRVASSNRIAIDSARALDVEIERFKGRSAPGLEVLAGIAGTLPDDAVMTALAVDSGAVQATVLASKASSLIEALGRINGADSLNIVGAITREPLPVSRSVNAIPGPGLGAVADAVMMERVAVRFDVTRMITNASTAPVSPAATGASAVAVAARAESGPPR
jgi:hypothetical protein